MSKLPELEGSSIISPQNVTSRARGHDAVSSMFGNAQKFGTETAASAAESESKSNLFSSTALASQARTDYDIALKSNPSVEATSQAYKQYTSSLQAIQENAFVNSEDRGLLGKQLQSDQQAGQKEYAFNAIKQEKITSHITLANSFPNQLTNITRDVFERPELADQAIQTTHATLSAAVHNGVLTMGEYEKYNTMLTKTIERSQEMVARVGLLEAHNYHAGVAFTDEGHQPNAPHNMITKGMYAGLVSDYNYQDVTAAIQTGGLKQDPGMIFYSVSKLSDEQFSKMLNTIDGVSISQGYINSGHPYEAIKERVEFLNARKGSTLTVAEQAERDNLSQYITNMQYDFYDTIRDTPQGLDIVNNYNRNMDAITENATLSLDQKAGMMNYETNQYMSGLVNYGHALGVPAEYIKPVSLEVASETQGAFNLGADPNIALTKINNLSTSNAAYLASSMKYPNQREVLMTASLLPKDKSGMKEIFVQANQQGIDYKGLMFNKENGMTDTQLKAKIVSNLAPVLNYMGRSSMDNTRGTGMTEMVTNTVKYLALRNNDLELTNIKTYIKEATDAVNNAYKIESGSFYSFNASQQPISKVDAKALAEYARDSARSVLGGNISDVQMMANEDVNPLYVSMNEAGLVTVSDSRSNVVWQAPYTDDMLNAARHDYEGRNPVITEEDLRRKVGGSVGKYV